MSFDGVFTHTMVNELSPLLTGARLSRISQPYPNELIITVRANRHNYPLLLSAHPSYARLQITEIPFVNPEKPTNFTMTLRKYLDGAILKSIKQIDNDRVVHLTFTARNEIGDQE
ncbi:MAG: NFACT family protein, partial [Loigolactobacillus coryniformis]